MSVIKAKQKKTLWKYEFNASGRRRIIIFTFIAFLLVECNLILLDLVFNHLKFFDYKPIRQLFNMELEGSLANWISSIVYLSVGISLWAISIKEKILMRAKLKSFLWSLIACFFTYLAIDDGASIHERVGTTLKLFYNKHNWNPEYSTLHYVINEFPSYYWQIVFIPILMIAAILIFIFLWRALDSYKLLFLTGVAFFIMAGAQFLDYLEGIHYTYPLIQDFISIAPKTLRHYSKVCEEFLEMFGMTILLSVFIFHLISGLNKIEIELNPKSKD